jgi:WhiB family redox-sensing transcriptional regulator
MILTRFVVAAPAIARDPEEWTAAALCQQTDPELFFPHKGKSSRPAKQICAACPVTAECLIFGMDDPNGVYGGLSPNERENLRRANGTRCPRCGEWFVNLTLHVRTHRAAA